MCMRSASRLRPRSRFSFVFALACERVPTHYPARANGEQSGSELLDRRHRSMYAAVRRRMAGGRQWLLPPDPQASVAWSVQLGSHATGGTAGSSKAASRRASSASRSFFCAIFLSWK